MAGSPITRPMVSRVKLTFNSLGSLAPCCIFCSYCSRQSARPVVRDGLNRLCLQPPGCLEHLHGEFGCRIGRLTRRWGQGVGL